MGEFEFIESVRRSFKGVGDPAILGIGDDCAVLPLPGGGASGESREAFVVTCDMLVEGVHFLLEAGTACELGAKSLAVNLSDVAAMGARPVASFLSLALPPGCRGAWAEAFMDGYREMSERHGVKLAGGDTTASLAGVAINVTAIGRAPLERLKYRSGARAGDIVVVNGALGESAAGLADILAGRHDTPAARTHRNPVPQVAEGEWLGGRTEVHSMIDLSDGLASDLLHILRASGGAGGDQNAGGGLSAEIDLAAIPTSLQEAAGDEAIQKTAVTGGEDYKLLFTVAPDSYDRLSADYRARFGQPLHPVGRIVPAVPGAPAAPGSPGIVWLEGGTPVPKTWRGFTHF